MIRLLPALSLLAMPMISTVSANAASFDCTQATTPFEKAICADEGLSRADERLAQAYSFAQAGLSEKALGLVKKSQQDWLGYAQKACTRDNTAMLEGVYDERMIWCLSTLFDTRSDALEMSRISWGKRLYPVASFASFPDRYVEEEPDFRWPVGQHEMSVIQIDSDEAYAEKLNAALLAQARERFSVEDVESDDDALSAGGEDSAVVIDLLSETWEHRLSFRVETSWYPHGAAHGGHGTSYLHYLTEEQRFASADDLFSGKKWKEELAILAAAALEAQLGPILFPEALEPKTLVDIVGDVSRWDFSNYLGLSIQFQPYEVAPYAFGTPSILIVWDKLEPMLKEGGALR